MGIDISLLLKPGLNSLINLGGKLFQLQPVLLNFLLHHLLLRKRLLLILDQLLKERKTIFTLLFHSNQYNNRSHHSLLLENVEEVLHLKSSVLGQVSAMHPVLGLVFAEHRPQ